MPARLLRWSPRRFPCGEAIHAHHRLRSRLQRVPGEYLFFRGIVSPCAIHVRHLTLCLRAVVVAVVYSELHTKAKITDQKHFHVRSRCPLSLSFTTYVLPNLSSVLSPI